MKSKGPALVALPDFDRAALKDFIKRQMEIHGDVTAREFARRVGVSHSTIGDYLGATQNSDIRRPTTDFLLQLARATNTNFVELIVVIFPTMATELSLDSNAVRLAQDIQKLPDVYRTIIEAILREGRVASAKQD